MALETAHVGRGCSHPRRIGHRLVMRGLVEAVQRTRGPSLQLVEAMLAEAQRHCHPTELQMLQRCPLGSLERTP
jgi:hypothetical protein